MNEYSRITKIISDDKFNKISNEFAYIKLYEDFYVGINSDKLNVYKYDNTKGLLDEEVAVSNNEFEIKKLDDNYDVFKDIFGSYSNSRKSIRT